MAKQSGRAPSGQAGRSSTGAAKASPPSGDHPSRDVLDIIAAAYMRGYAAKGTEVVETAIDGAVAQISWVQRDVDIYGFGRGDNSGVLAVPLAALVSQPAEALAVPA